MSDVYASRSRWSYPDPDQPDDPASFHDWRSRPTDPDVMKETVRRLGDPNMRYDPETRALQLFGTRPDGYLGFYPLTADQERAAKEQAFGGASRPAGATSPQDQRSVLERSLNGGRDPGMGAAFNNAAGQPGSIRANPNFQLAARQGQTDWGQARPDDRPLDADTPAFMRDLQSDSEGTHSSNPLLIKTGRLHDAGKIAEGAYEIFSKARTAKKGFDAFKAVAENRIDDDDIASNTYMVKGGKMWVADVQSKPGWAGSEFATIAVTDDGFLLTTDNGFNLGAEFTHQPAPILVHTQYTDQWSDPRWLRLERDNLINQRGAVGKTGEFAADFLTGKMFPGPSEALHDGFQWVMSKWFRGPRTMKYPGFTDEQSNLIRQAAIEARLAQLRHRGIR